MELSALGEHLRLCHASCGRLFALRCAADTLNSFVAARLVTALAGVGLLVGLAILVW